MSRHEGDTQGDVALSVPTWFMTILKVSMPAIIVGVSMYFRVASLEDTQVDQKRVITSLESKLNDKSDRILLLEQEQKSTQALNTVAHINAAKALERIENDLKVMQADVKEIRSKQAQLVGK